MEGSDQVNACMRGKCGPATARFLSASGMASPRQKEFVRRFTAISQRLRDGKMSAAQAAQQRRALRAEANQQPAVQQYRRCMAMRCEAAMYALAAGTIAFIERAVDQRRAQRRPIGQHQKQLAGLLAAVRERSITPQLLAEALSELPP